MVTDSGANTGIGGHEAGMLACALVILNSHRHIALLLPIDGGEWMPAPRITMRKLNDILRLKHQAGLSHAKIAAALGLSKGVVGKYVSLAKGIAWPPEFDS